jgi:hypothetical protein
MTYAPGIAVGGAGLSPVTFHPSCPAAPYNAVSAMQGDRRLMERVAQGDQAAFTDLVQRYGGRLLAVAGRLRPPHPARAPRGLRVGGGRALGGLPAVQGLPARRLSPKGP